MREVMGKGREDAEALLLGTHRTWRISFASKYSSFWSGTRAVRRGMTVIGGGPRRRSGNHPVVFDIEPHI